MFELPSVQEVLPILYSYLIYKKGSLLLGHTVHILDGNSEIGARARSSLRYLICQGHLIIFKAVRIDVISFATCSELPSIRSTMEKSKGNAPL